MSDNKLQKNVSTSIKEKGQYILAFGVVSSVLLVAEIPVFVVFFFGVFGYLLLKMFASASKSETREIFEFYLTANEILRDDERRWYGFEIHEAITRGEGIIQKMSGAPPLVHFTLGALYNKIGDHKAAVGHLAFIVESDSSDESAFAYPSPELRSYVKVLRKIERDPAEAPMTSAAVRGLERARRIRAKLLLEESRTAFANSDAAKLTEPAVNQIAERQAVASITDEIQQPRQENGNGFSDNPQSANGRDKSRDKRSNEDKYANRKPISEVLHDIYDKNVQ